MPGQRRISSASQARRRRPRRGMRVEHRLDRVELVGAQVAEQLARAGDDVERVAASAARSGPRSGGAGRAGRACAATACAAAASASSALRPRSGAEPECALRPWRGDVDRARGLAPHDDALVVAGQLAGLEAQAGVEAREALDVAERRRPPLLVADQQQRDLGVELRALGERAQRADGEDRRRPSCRRCRSRRAARRRAASGRCSACATTVSTWPSSSDPARAACRAGAATRSSAWPGDEHGTRSIVRLVGHAARRTPTAHSFAPWTSPRRRGDGHQRLELARRAPRDLRRRLPDPRIHRAAG